MKTLTAMILSLALGGCASLGTGYYDPQVDRPAQVQPQQHDEDELPPTHDGRCLCVPSDDGCSEVIC